MNDLQTMQFAIGCSVVLMFGILGMVILELFRKLSKERELNERLRLMNSRNYHHRRTMEQAWFDFYERPNTVACSKMRETAKASRDDND